MRSPDAYLPIAVAFALTFVYLGLAALWTWRLVKPLAPGPVRLLACAPVVIFNLWVPMLVLDPKVSAFAMTVIGLFTFLGVTKVLALCMNRGALYDCYGDFSVFLVIFVFPVVPTAVLPPAKKEQDTLPSSWLLLLFQAVVYYGSFWYLFSLAVKMFITPWFSSGYLPMVIYEYTSATSIWLLLDGVTCFIAFLLQVALGLQVLRSCNFPTNASSVGDFWSGRWNLPVSYCLRHLIYNPIIEGQLLPRADMADTGDDMAGDDIAGSGGSQDVKKQKAPAADAQLSADAAKSEPPRRRHISLIIRLVASVATFGASGLWHELLFYYSMHEFTGWFLVFFLIQPFLIIGHHLFIRATKLPWVLCVLTTHLLFSTAIHFCWWNVLRRLHFLDLLAAQHGWDD